MKIITEKAASKALPGKVIAYIMDPGKNCRDSEGNLLFRTIGLDENRSYATQFQETAELAGNYYTDRDRKYYHFKYTVSPDDYAPESGVTRILPEQVLNEAETLALEMFSGYQCVITVQYHNNGLSEENRNRKHLHAHIVVNASSYLPGQRKLNLLHKDLDLLRDYAYQVGRKYHLQEKDWREEVIAKRARKKTERPEKLRLSTEEKAILQKYGKHFSDYSWKEQYRIAVDEARKETTTLALFMAYLRIFFKIKTWVLADGELAFKIPQRRSYTSGAALGEYYCRKPIQKDLEETGRKYRTGIPIRRNWNLQRQMDMLRVAEELGANTPAELELRIREEGKRFGEVKREYHKAKARYQQLLSDDAEEIRKAEQRCRELEETYRKEKIHYIKCMRAQDTARAVNASEVIYSTDNLPDTVPNMLPAVRTKEEAETERLRRWAELREWTDAAIRTAARNAGGNDVENLRQWAKEMEKYGCRIRITEKTISIRHPESSQPVRTNRLGGAYEKEEIIHGIQIQRDRIARGSGSRESDRFTGRMLPVIRNSGSLSRENARGAR